MKRRILLGIQLTIFAAWAAYLMTARSADSPEFYLETNPVDPRDLISGTYVALSYAIGDLDAPDCHLFKDQEQDLFVKLVKSGRKAMTEQGPVSLYVVATCSAEAPHGPGWVKAYNDRRGAAKYGIERFYLNENDPRKDARSGTVLAKVKIGRDRRLALLDLIKRTDSGPADAGMGTAVPPASSVKPGPCLVRKIDSGVEISPASGKSFVFNGADSLVEAELPKELDGLLDGGHPATVAFWYNRQDHRGDALFIKGADPFMSMAHFDASIPDRLVFYFKNGRDQTSIRVYSGTFSETGEWVHLGITYDGRGLARGVEIYKNGQVQPVRVINDGLEGTVGNAGPLTLGAYRSGTGPGWFFNGGIAGFQLSGRVLTAPEMAELAKAPPAEDD